LSQPPTVSAVIDAPFEFELTPGLDAPSLARRLLTQSLMPALANGVLDTAELLVSELVTNAVTHGRGRITVRAQLSERRLFVEVVDEGDGFEPVLRERDSTTPEVGGWGLTVVHAESSRWGVSRDSSRVWFELERPRPHPAAADDDPTG
jgi:Histidine kinase-like ATPase domain